MPAWCSLTLQLIREHQLLLSCSGVPPPSLAYHHPDLVCLQQYDVNGIYAPTGRHTPRYYCTCLHIPRHTQTYNRSLAAVCLVDPVTSPSMRNFNNSAVRHVMLLSAKHRATTGALGNGNGIAQWLTNVGSCLVFSAIQNGIPNLAGQENAAAGRVCRGKYSW